MSSCSLMIKTKARRFFHSNLCAHSFGCRRLNVALGLMTAEKIYDIKNAVHTIVNSLSLSLSAAWLVLARACSTPFVDHRRTTHW